MENKFCHNGMKCQDGCPCAGKDGICHCPMADEQKCMCKSHCKEKEEKQIIKCLGKEADFLGTFLIIK